MKIYFEGNFRWFKGGCGGELKKKENFWVFLWDDLTLQFHLVKKNP